jgi:hypothetical protein
MNRREATTTIEEGPVKIPGDSTSHLEDFITESEPPIHNALL